MATLSKQAIEGAYRQLYPIVLGKCSRMLHDPNEAQDVAQEVFMKLWNSRERIEDTGAVTAWIYRVATNAAVDRLRMRRNEVSNSNDLLELLPSAIAAPDIRSHWRQTLQALIAEMPEGEIQVAILNRVDGLSHPEIAEVLQTSERTIRRTLVKLDERIARFLGRRGEDA
jgi:RNA polymerase sigma-70 factor, ECF subfamily